MSAKKSLKTISVIHARNDGNWEWSHSSEARKEIYIWDIFWRHKEMKFWKVICKNKRKGDIKPILSTGNWVTAGDNH